MYKKKFLKNWSDDWRGHTMKVLLSQTVFAGVATHHGKYDGYLKADLDSDEEAAEEAARAARRRQGSAQTPATDTGRESKEKRKSNTKRKRESTS